MTMLTSDRTVEAGIGAGAPVQRRYPLRLILRLAADDGANDLRVFDLLWIDRVRIIREDDEVSEFARGDRPFDGFLEGGIRAVDGVDAQCLIDGDALIDAPGAAIPPLARDHSLHAHERRERTGA